MIPVPGNIKPKEEPTMQNNPRKQDIIQELRDKRQDVTELCTCLLYTSDAADEL